jgi:hypothetical protein
MFGFLKRKSAFEFIVDMPLDLYIDVLSDFIESRRHYRKSSLEFDAKDRVYDLQYFVYPVHRSIEQVCITAVLERLPDGQTFVYGYTNITNMFTVIGAIVVAIILTIYVKVVAGIYTYTFCVPFTIMAFVLWVYLKWVAYRMLHQLIQAQYFRKKKRA